MVHFQGVLGRGWEEGGRLLYKSDRDACGKIQIKPLRETNVGVAEDLTDP